MQVLQVLGILLEIVLLFNFIILVHELGHYLAARWRGLKIEKFQIWFGKPIWSKKVNGVQWGLGWIPAGGFVALPQMAPMEALEGRAEGPPPPPIKPLDKIIVAVAGPLFSFGLAIILACLVWKLGHPVSQAERSTTIGYIDEKASKDAKDQFRPGDIIKSIDNRPVKSWGGMNDSVVWNIISSQGDEIPFEIERDGQRMEIKIKATAKAQDKLTDAGIWSKITAAVSGFFTRPELRKVGLMSAFYPKIGLIYPNSPAEKAGLKPNDVIVGLNGQRLFHHIQISDAAKANPDKPIKLEIKRGDLATATSFFVEATPRVPDELKLPDAKTPPPMLGIQWDQTGVTTIEYPSPRDQLNKAFGTMYNTLSAVASPKSDLSPRHLSGPVGIWRVYYNLFEDKDGWRRALWFSVILNINLAILNMMPLPVLDGGHILMALIEWIRGRTMNIRVLEYVQAGCAIALIGFMLYLTGFDVTDIFSGKRGSGGSAEPVFYAEPKAAAP